MAAHRSSHQITYKIKKIRWLDVRGSVRDVFIGLVAGDGLAGKGYTSKLLQGIGEAQKPAWRSCAGSVMPEMKQNQQCGRLGCSKKQQNWI